MIATGHPVAAATASGHASLDLAAGAPTGPERAATRWIETARSQVMARSSRLLIGQAGGATAVINQSLVAAVQEARSLGCFSDVWGMRRGAEGALQEDLVDLGSLSAGTLAGIARTPGVALGSSRHRLSDDDTDTLLDLFRRYQVGSLLYIGGNDSADTVHRLARLAHDRRQDLAAIAIPKTIDNDLPATDHSPGYGSIARYVAVAAMDSAKDTESMPSMYPVKIMEVMGRDAGWVAAAATLARRSPEDPPHLIYPPERPLSLDRLLHDIQRVHHELGLVVAVAAETVRDENGEPLADPSLSGERDAFGHQLLRGTADTMCRVIQTELGLRARYDKPGSLQRMSSLCVSPVDREEAAEVGRAAVRLVARGVTDRMVTIIRDADEPYRYHIDSVALSEVANRQRLLPDEFLTPDGTDTTEAFHRYALPLLGPAALPLYTRLQAPPLKL